MQHQARKRFGQNFLIDPNIINRIITAIDPGTGDRIVEIGPGLGALTRPILNIVDSIDVIELDRDVIPKLIANCDGAPGLRVHQADILRFDLDDISNEERTPLKIIGNLPYNISTPVLFHLLKYHPIIENMTFMLQKEVVDRITAHPGDKNYGRLSVMLQTWFECHALFDVAPGCFSPAPKVDSAIIRFVPTSDFYERIIDQKHFEDLVRRSFSQRRKTLRNNLRKICDSASIESCGIDPGARAETLDVGAFITLHRRILNT